MKKKRISNAVIRRLPRYYRSVDDLHYNGEVRISSSALGKSMGLTASQIRQDLSCFGEFGQQGYGYDVEKLRSALSDILGMNNGYTAIIMGAGNLGRALIQNFSFAHYGFQLTAAFDTDPALVGSHLAEVPIYHPDELEARIAQLKPDVAILTTPRSVVSKTANRLVEAGVTGLWNFTNVEVRLVNPEKAVVENVHFADSLLALSFMLGAHRSRQDEPRLSEDEDDTEGE
ncbi:Redox-sensing transcriptional repressor Rex [bioreactor metagenome]|uniref:Redox-sensing transcriptional repressor Rex n=1 Tax=bioreactor metagenome TaxID=1076179 RepID=A0A645CQX1_9ZZZZ